MKCPAQLRVMSAILQAKVPDLQTDLERYFHGELNLPRRKRAADCAESGTGNVRSCSLKIRAIENVKEFGTKFKARFFVNRQFELFMHA